ncbi:hypothetical protein C0992_002979 [Termitomyces sp. T32_za158]|nr:hypothetical protein C0992_002979 [Termitomyces sp. T32_za158]
MPGMQTRAQADGASSDSSDDVFYEADDGLGAEVPRRKSVRVSLQPSFRSAQDVWEDSSDEDPESNKPFLPFGLSSLTPPVMSDHETTQQSNDVKSEDANSTINIKVVSSTGEEVFFKIKRSTKLSKLQGAYANKVGKDVNSIRFLYDGARISEDDTPTSLDMEDNDTIDVMVEQVGGSA